MHIVRHKREGSFTLVANASVRDPKLSLRARGLLVTLLSRPDDWRTSTEEISHEVKEGRDAVRRAAGELEAAGYLRRIRAQDEKGHWRTSWVLYDEPWAADDTG